MTWRALCIKPYAAVWTMTLPSATDAGAALTPVTDAAKMFSGLASAGFTAAKVGPGRYDKMRETTETLSNKWY